ncbi:TPA: hypothetical protein QDB06_000862 [Burkholderia vietnamiensis]|nr:hypothetical protein [Burkholderia vietnamiensis]
MNKKLGIALLTSIVLAACGGGGGDGSTASNNGSSTPTTPVTPPTPINSTLTASQYAVYKYGLPDTLGGSGAYTATANTTGTLSLGADGTTTLTVTDPTSFGMSASGYYILNRVSGGVIMLCDNPASTVGTGSKSKYVAVATASSTATVNQATQLTSSVDLAGQTLYNIEDCSYQNKAGTAEGQNSAPDANTSAMTFDSSGNITFNNGNPSITTANATTYLQGGAIPQSNGSTYLTAYKIGNQYLVIERGTSTSVTGYIGMWITNN